MRYNKYIVRLTARCLLLTFTFQLVYPNVVMALTSGPTQPEVQSFEPVGTTDMVDMFTGDFNYNIPLLDIEGYPINISYHGGVGMEQEASWVGLGWNINPGVINRNVRGIPDDFDGEKLTKELHIKDEEIIRLGTEFGGEVGGLGDPSPLKLEASFGGNVTVSNYRGVSADLNFNTGVQLFNSVSAGVNLGVGSQTGADVDLYAGIGIASSQLISKDMAAGVGVNFGTGYNTRTSLKDINFSVTGSLSTNNISAQRVLSSGNIPIATRNFVPVITNSSTMHSYYGRIKAGAEFAWSNIWGAIKGKYSNVHFDGNGTRHAYGYMYAEDARQDDIHDFTREKDGTFNKSMKYLPLASMTYDVYAVSGQGTGGTFRPFRNDMGSVYDPVTVSEADDYSGQIEGSLGWLFAVGVDASAANTTMTSGPWDAYFKHFVKGIVPGNVFEKIYFKQGGDLALVDQDYWTNTKKYDPIEASDFWNIPADRGEGREPRSILYNCYKADEVLNTDANVTSNTIQNYFGLNGFQDGFEDSIATISRMSGSRRTNQLSQVVQTQTDGRRYIYGLPAMNNIQRESNFAVNGEGDGDGLIAYSGTDDGMSNRNGIDQYYSSTITPSFAHSYLLTSVLSADYVDVTGNGASEDDIGSYNKFNYALKSDDYRWKAPAQSGKAQYNPGFLSDTRDNKASYVIGSREQWALHSIESKNFVAEFYTSQREDGKGVTEAIKGGGGVYESTASAAKQYSYKLDSIKLYSKHDRILNKAAAVPIKTVFFEYTDTLCRGVPNANGGGKLTLNRISFRYGNSNKSIVSPYQFTYSAFNPDYNIGKKDRWGNYKAISGELSNQEYPYVEQSDTANHTYAGAWSLAQITLPSGGIINVDYEADDYASVQGATATEMFKVAGVGFSNAFVPTNTLYMDKHNSNKYIYFKRDKAREVAGFDARANYFSSADILYFSINVKLRDKFEQIRGYANVSDVGYAGADYGYVAVNSVGIEGSDASLNPVTYTALNTGRYNLPHILFPGSDPGATAMENILSGMRQSVGELIRIGQNPLVHMIKQGWANEINPGKSFIRLNSPGRKKTGGGYRVKKLTFSDTWDSMAGGINQQANYGKAYDYTTKDATGGIYTSGVASYEPLIGGDENPLKKPIAYSVQKGSHFPPNDAVDLYQEAPLGESLFPSPVVGYSKVTVSSIHQSVGRSSQEVDVYQFYTAADFPSYTAASPISAEDVRKFKLLKQDYALRATQGYSINLNDMHGRPRSVEHYVRKVSGIKSTLEKVSYQIYRYSKDNMVDVANLTSSGIAKQTALVGVETDVTLDSRKKTEHTNTMNINGNLNVSTLIVIPIPIVLIYPWKGEYSNEFCSAVITKVTQRYAILTEVESYNEGALTVMKNEVFDPLTGQPIVTSVNNEFKDKEYTVTYPAYWAYKEMGGGYQNTGYTDTFSNVPVDATKGAILPASGRKLNYNVGDEILMQYKNAGNSYTCIAYVMGYGNTSGECQPLLKPKFLNLPSNYGWAGGTFTEVSLKILRSGRRNLLNDYVQSYTAFSTPFTGSPAYLTDSLPNVIDIKARTFAEPKTHTFTAADTYMNAFANGKYGIYRLTNEYTYQNLRDYSSPGVRKAGVFPIRFPWRRVIDPTGNCGGDGNDNYDDQSLVDMVRLKTPTRASYMYPYFDQYWKLSRAVTMWSPYATEVQNTDAVQSYSTAVYGFNEELPTAVAYNARQGEVLYDGYEDYAQASVLNSMTRFFYSPFKPFFTQAAISGSTKYGVLDIAHGSGGATVVYGIAHTGNYSFSTNGNNVQIHIPLDTVSATDHYYKPFAVKKLQKYVLSYWVQPTLNDANVYPVTMDSMPPLATFKKSQAIDKWRQIECVFTAKAVGPYHNITFPSNVYIDDIRIYPLRANMKSFAYNVFNEKLMATLDENNYATFYEYDAEGNLIRTKKETERGVMTISESRSANPKAK